jgi:hypothetical protein
MKKELNISQCNKKINELLKENKFYIPIIDKCIEDNVPYENLQTIVDKNLEEIKRLDAIRNELLSDPQAKQNITTTVLGGGNWTCHKCGKTIFGTSIYHDCVPNYDHIFPNFKKTENNMETFNYEYHPNMERYITRLTKEWKEHKKILLAVDFDDTLSPWKFDDFNYSEVFKLINQAKELGAYVVIFTACKEERYDYIRKYCKEMGGFEIDGINENVIELPYGNNRKIYYNHLLDDRGGLMQAMTILSIAMMRVKTDGKNGGDNFDV